MENNLPPEASRRRPQGWWARTWSGALALIIGIGSLWLLKALAWPLALLVAGTAVAAAFAPIVEWLSQWLPRTLAVILLYIVFLLVVALLAWLVLPPLWVETQELFDEAPQLYEQWQKRINSWLPGNRFSVENVMNRFLSSGGSGTGNVLMQGWRQLLNWTTAIVVIVFVSAYGLILGPHARQFYLSLFPETREDEALKIVTDTLDAMGGFVRGTLIDGLLVGVLTYVGLLVIGFPYQAPLAVTAGVMEIVPVVGPFITAVLLVAIGLTQSTNLALLALGFALVLQQVESNVIIPNVMRHEAKLSPLVTLLALIAGERIGGLIGALVAIPLVAGLRVLVMRLVVPAVRNLTGAAADEQSS